MSILSSLIRDLRSIVVPRSCAVCGGDLPPTKHLICSACEATAPLTNLWCEPSNAMMERFWGLLPVCHASALFWYVEGSPWRDAVHRFKYAGRWLSAYDMGRWYGALMREAGTYADVDVIVPVPLHWWRRIGRGYNQAEYIARGIARELGVEVASRAVVRHRYNESQTRQSNFRRWANVEGIFRVRRAEELRGKHILLVDDVFTTGATILSLGETILRAVPDARLSVAVLATTRRSLRQQD
ncbi:MAG: ComF family protein [Alistipes sp.]|nr:ComF family protein [Alistipes sp.]